jgi:hypothetical protein
VVGLAWAPARVLGAVLVLDDQVGGFPDRAAQAGDERVQARGPGLAEVDPPGGQAVVLAGGEPGRPPHRGGHVAEGRLVGRAGRGLRVRAERGVDDGRRVHVVALDDPADRPRGGAPAERLFPGLRHGDLVTDLVVGAADVAGGAAHPAVPLRRGRHRQVRLTPPGELPGQLPDVRGDDSGRADPGGGLGSRAERDGPLDAGRAAAAALGLMVDADTRFGGRGLTGTVQQDLGHRDLVGAPADLDRL